MSTPQEERVIFRGWLEGILKFEDHHTTSEDGDWMTVAEQHIKKLWPGDPADMPPHMIEIEFPDEPSNERFIRFGTDPKMMVNPLQLKDD
jgi:hypothetical protein